MNRTSSRSITFTFSEDENGYLDKHDIERTLKASDMCAALFQISQEVFRPIRKHGYSDREIQDLTLRDPELARDLVGALEHLFYEILEDRGIDLERLWS